MNPLHTVASPRPIILIACGGTIACVPEGGGLVPRLNGSQILEEAGIDPRGVTVVDALRLDSTEVTNVEVHTLAELLAEAHREAPRAGVVITFGTDTQTETAAKIARLCADVAASVPVAFVGSFLHPRHVDWDGAENLHLACQWAGLGAPGVVVAAAGRVWDPEVVVKLGPSVEYGFGGRTDGLVATWSIHEGLRIRQAVQHLAPSAVPRLPAAGTIGRFTLHHDASAAHLAGLLAAGVEAVVLEAFGDGNFPVAGDRGAALKEQLRDAAARGVLLIVVSQTPFGSADCAYPGGRELVELGVQGWSGTFASAAARAGTVIALTAEPTARAAAWQETVPGDRRRAAVRQVVHGAASIFAGSPAVRTLSH